jgi:histone arginine demethylase JMJD6
MEAEIARLVDELTYARAAVESEPDAGKREYREEIARRLEAARDKCRKISETVTTTAATTTMAVRRVHASTLSLAAFRREYVATDTPVVITGLEDELTEDGADGEKCAWLLKRGGTKKVAVTRNDAHVKSELSCANADVVDLSEHFHAVMRDEAPGSYLYDCSIPLKLPSLGECVRIPRYFAHDFAQQTMRLHAFSRSWPSLFVAAKDTRSSLHVDQWQGHFFMAQVRGTKRWTVFHRDDTAYLQPSWRRGTLDPALPALSTFDDTNRVAFAKYARRWDVDLGPGEVLFVPGGAPHAVHNIDATVAFAGNFIDETNIDRALFDLRLMGLNQGAAMMATFDALDEVEFDPTLGAFEDTSTNMRNLVVRCDEYIGGGGSTLPFTREGRG